MLRSIVNLLKVSAIRVFKKSKPNFNIWVFSSSYNTKFNYNSKYLFEYVLENEPSIIPLYVINDDVLRAQLQEQYGEKYFIETKSIQGINQVLHAGVWFTSAGLPAYGFGLNRKRLIINLWHGIPLKKIALLEENSSKFNRIYFKYIFSNNYSYIITTSKRLISIMKDSFGVKEEQVKVLGQPRNDVLFKKNKKELVLQKLYTDLPNYKYIILYAPTYRDNSKTNIFPFGDFEKEKLNDFLEEHKILIFIRSHQSESDDIKKRDFGNRVRLINEDLEEDIMNIINIFDLLITDYSSIYIDFLITTKPVMFLPYDKDEYMRERGFNFDYNKVTPGPKPANLSEFMKEVLLLMNNPNYYLAEREKSNKYFNEITDRAAEKICDFAKKESNVFN